MRDKTSAAFGDDERAESDLVNVAIALTTISIGIELIIMRGRLAILVTLSRDFLTPIAMNLNAFFLYAFVAEPWGVSEWNIHKSVEFG
ncbi:MAG: hypothetical protein C0483_14205 [Pirellula sp.]|nr:hypothetical protein [Pirellula sp.]